MFPRLVWESFARQRRRKILAGIAILLGTTAVTAMLALALTIGDRIHSELAVYGANIVVFPKADSLAVKVGGVDVKPATGGAYLKESDLEKLKGIFWANNITGVSPELDLGGDGSLYRGHAGVSNSVKATDVFFDYRFGTLSTGVLALHPWWKVEGQIPDDYLKKFGWIETLVGSRLAARLNLHVGDTFGYEPPKRMHIGASFGEAYKVVGVLTSGDEFEDELLIPHIAAAPLFDGLSRVEISARTKPEDAFARQNPDTMSPSLRDVWYCRPYANSIAYQIREAIPGADAEQVRRVEQSEGTVLERISGLMWLISGAALLAAGFAVSAAMATAVLERRGEIGLMRSLGASKGAIATLFYAESGLLALVTGTVGYLAGSGLAWWLGARIFPGDGRPPLLNLVLLPVIVSMALIVAIAGSTPAIRAALSTDPGGDAARGCVSKFGLGKLLRRSLIFRKARSISALVALTVSAGIATALLTLYADLDAKLHHEFRSFGANVVVNGTADLAAAQKAGGPDVNVAQFAYAVATTDRGTPVVVVGVDFPAVRRLDSWWQVATWPTGTEDALLGERAAQFVGDERQVTLTFAGKAHTFSGVGHVKTGGDEDSRIYLPMRAFSAWTGVSPTVLEVQIPGGAATVDAAIARLKAALPGADVEPVRQLVEGESAIVDKTHALMFGAVILIALTVGVSVLATLSASVLERRRDFALMKALGSSEGQMMGLFLAETLLLAGGGVVAGYVLGSVAAWVISEVNFSTASLPRISVFPMVLALNVGIAAVAALLPIRVLKRLEPAALLRGE